MSKLNKQIRNALNTFDVEQARELLRDALAGKRGQPNAETYRLAARAAIDDEQKQEFLNKAADLDGLTPSQRATSASVSTKSDGWFRRMIGREVWWHRLARLALAGLAFGAALVAMTFVLYEANPRLNSDYYTFGDLLNNWQAFIGMYALAAAVGINLLAISPAKRQDRSWFRRLILPAVISIPIWFLAFNGIYQLYILNEFTLSFRYDRELDRLINLYGSQSYSLMVLAGTVAFFGALTLSSAGNRSVFTRFILRGVGLGVAGALLFRPFYEVSSVLLLSDEEWYAMVAAFALPLAAFLAVSEWFFPQQYGQNAPVKQTTSSGYMPTPSPAFAAAGGAAVGTANLAMTNTSSKQVSSVSTNKIKKTEPVPVKNEVVPARSSALVKSEAAAPAPVIVPNMIYNPNPRARAKVSSTQKVVPGYSRPAFGSKVITNMPQNKRFPIIGKTNDEQWWQILIQGIPAWVSASSVKAWNLDAVPVTYIPDGGVPAAQEIYFLYVLGQQRDAIKQLSNPLTPNLAFLNETEWVERQRIMIPVERRDPEYITPAEGGVGMLERQIRDDDPNFKRLRTIFGVTWILGMILAIGLASTVPPLAAVLGVVAAVMPLALGILTIYYSRGFLHKNFQTKSQLQTAQMQQYATIAAGVAATAAAVAVASSANKQRKPGEKSTLAHLGNFVKEAAPVVGKAAPAIGAAGSVYMAKRAMENAQEGKMVEAQSVPLVPLHTFISYRWRHSQNEAEWLFDQLSDEFAPGSIFLDREEIRAGNDFRSELLENLSQAKAVLVLMGPDWLAEMTKRARNPDKPDYVREEIQFALENRIMIIPVLHKGVKMPAEEDLPTEIGLLAYRQSFELPQTKSELAPLIQRIKDELSKHVLVNNDE